MVSIANDLRATMSVGVLRFDKVTVVDTTCRRIERVVSPDVAMGKDLTGRIGMLRAMYRQCGMNPTKTRPSSEALLKRLRRGDPFPRINTLVDICNACSVQTLLPYGLYDSDRINRCRRAPSGATGGSVSRHPKRNGARGRSPGAV